MALKADTDANTIHNRLAQMKQRHLQRAILYRSLRDLATEDGDTVAALQYGRTAVAAAERADRIQSRGHRTSPADPGPQTRWSRHVAAPGWRTATSGSRPVVAAPMR